MGGVGVAWEGETKSKSISNWAESEVEANICNTLVRGIGCVLNKTDLTVRSMFVVVKYNMLSVLLRWDNGDY